MVESDEGARDSADIEETEGYDRSEPGKGDLRVRWARMIEAGPDDGEDMEDDDNQHQPRDRPVVVYTD